MEIEIKGDLQEEIDKIEYLDIERAVLHRGGDDIEVFESEDGVQIEKNPEEDLETSQD